ncbi:MAG: AMP-binding protein, partial [Pseudorhodoplanes sp.]
MSGSFAWQPSQALIDGTTLSAFLRLHGLADQADLLERADTDPDWYWDALIRFFDIRFSTPYEAVLDTSRGIEWPTWCKGGATNATWNCLGRHRGSPSWDREAVVWESEDGRVVRWTFSRLDAETARLAELLRARGIGQGDVVGLYLPMLPEAVAAFFAILEIGAIVMPLFSGFGRRPLAERFLDSGAKAVVTCHSSMRRGKSVPMYETVAAASGEAPSLDTIVVLDPAGSAIARSGRDAIWSTAQTAQPRSREPEMVLAETPAMLMYTSGTTGKPKGTVHTHCGILAKNALDMGLCLDVKADDRLLWMSDMGWIVGPKIVVRASLFGATLLMAEGTPDWPHPARMFQVAAHHRATIVGVVPTTVRQMMRHGTSALDGIDLQHLRATISIGEPWTPDAWVWFFENVCRRRIPILNYAGGTECGGAILISSFLHKLKPCAFGHTVPGCGADVVDPQGRSLP